MAADWQAIKIEYITAGTSYRKLSEKHGISRTQIYNVGKKEGWVQLRKQYLAKTVTKSVNAIGDIQARRAEKIASVADKLIGKIEAYIDAVEPEMMDAKAIKHISGAIKDLRDIHFIRSDADIKEQEARIAKLQKEAQDNSRRNEDISIQWEEGMEEYAE